jgi:hypothetical protein
VRIQYRFSDNLNEREVERYVAAVEGWILDRRDSLHVKSTYSYFTHNYAFTRAYLAPGWADDEGAQKVRDLLRRGLPELPGVKLTMQGPNDQSGPARLAVRVFGDPGPRLDQLADDVKLRLSQVEGLTDLTRSDEQGRHELQVAVSRDRAALAGLSPARVAEEVALFFRGRPLARFRGPDGEVAVQARLAESDRQSVERLRSLELRAPDGRTTPLAAVADFRTTETPASVERQQRRSVATVVGNYASSQGGAVRKAARRELEAMSLPAGYSWSFGEGFQEESETQKEMLVNLLMALALVYLVMAGLFESLLHPFAIMLALPFAFVVDLLPHAFAIQPDGPDRAPHPGRHRGEQRHRAAPPRPPAPRARHAATRGAARRVAPPHAADPDDDDHHRAGNGPARDRKQLRRGRALLPARPHGDRRPGGLDRAHAGAGALPLHPDRGRPRVAGARVARGEGSAAGGPGQRPGACDGGRGRPDLSARAAHALAERAPASASAERTSLASRAQHSLPAARRLWDDSGGDRRSRIPGGCHS